MRIMAGLEWYDKEGYNWGMEGRRWVELGEGKEGTKGMYGRGV